MYKFRQLKNLQSQLVSLFALTTQSQLHFLSFSGNKNIFSKFFIPVSRDQGLSQEMGGLSRPLFYHHRHWKHFSDKKRDFLFAKIHTPFKAKLPTLACP